MSRNIGVWHSPINQEVLAEDISKSIPTPQEKEAQLQEELKKSYADIAKRKAMGEIVKDAEIAWRLHLATQGDTQQSRLEEAYRQEKADRLVDSRLRSMRKEPGQTVEEFYREVGNWQKQANEIKENATREVQQKSFNEVLDSLSNGI